MNNRYNESNYVFRNGWFPTTLLVFLILIIGCDNDNPEKTENSGQACRIITINSSSQGKVDPTLTHYTSSSTQYTYDDANNQAGSTYEYKRQYGDGKEETAKLVIANDYDDGILTRRITESESKNIDDLVTTVTTTEEYFYDNQRLTRIETEEVGNGNTIARIATYEYDEDGKVIKYSMSDGSYKTIEYNGATISKVTTVTPAGKEIVRTYQYNTGGFLFSVVESGTQEQEHRYEIDDYGQVKRGEFYVDGQRQYAFTQTFDTKESALKLTSLTVEEQPFIPETYPAIIHRNNITKSEYFLPNEDFTEWVLTGSEEHVFDYTVDNYPIKRLTAVYQNGGMTSEMQTLYVTTCE